MYYDNSRVVPAHTSRKRPRSNDEDSHAFLPNSKKFIDSDVRNIFPDSSSSADDVSKRHYQTSLNNADVIMSEIQKPANGASISTIQHYRPELSWSQNPFYYHVNGILHEAHMQRLLRLSNVSV